MLATTKQNTETDGQQWPWVEKPPFGRNACWRHSLDKLLKEQGCRIVRYADDFVILCATQNEAEHALSRVREWMAQNQLALHPDKTHAGDCREQGQGFEFLGYRFEAGKRTVKRKSLSSSRQHFGLAVG